MDGGCNNITTFFFVFFLNPSLRDQTISFGYWWPKCNYMNICRKKSKKSKTLWCKQSYCFPVPTTMRKKLPKNSLKCMVLQIVQNLTVFGFFLNFFLFNRKQKKCLHHKAPTISEGYWFIVFNLMYFWLSCTSNKITQCRQHSLNVF